MTLEAIERRARHALRERIRLLVQMLTTSAYGSLGIAVADPIFKGSAFGLAHLVALAFGLACGSLAIYLSPQGERDAAV